MPLCQAFFILLCFLWNVNKKRLQKILQPKKGKRRCEAAFLKDTSNYFSLLNLKSLIERFGSLRYLWGGELEKFIKYIKVEMNTICDTDTFMSSVSNNLLCTHCLDNFMKNNQYYGDTNCQKQGPLNFIRVMKPLRKTFQLEKCCRVLLSRCQTVVRIYMFEMKK